MKTSICKTFTFDAAHQLLRHDGKCRSLHGHTYRLEVEVSRHELIHDKGPKCGMVMDFGDLSAAVKREVIDVLDHTYLNDLMPEFNPTAENLLVWIELRLRSVLCDAPYSRDVQLERLRLYETPDSYAEQRY